MCNNRVNIAKCKVIYKLVCISTDYHITTLKCVAFCIHAPMDVPYTDIPVKAFLTDTPEKVSDADTTVAAICDGTQVKVFHNDTKAKVFYIADA